MRGAFALLFSASAAMTTGFVCGGCGPARPPCVSGAACADNSSCVGGTCTTATELPARSTLRVVAKPVAIAWVRRGEEKRDAVVRLGGAAGGKLFLRFSVPQLASASDVDRLVAAHVVLTRVPGAPPLSIGGGEGTVLQSERVVDVWDDR